MKRLALIAVVAGSFVSVGPAAADRGVALDLGRVEIARGLTPGGGYRLPPVGVRNPGDEETTYRMVVSSMLTRRAPRCPRAGSASSLAR